MGIVQVQFSIDDVAAGATIATDLLKERLVACVQTVGPITSRYWWQGSVNETQEFLFLCKTTSERVGDVIECIRERHPYDVPEIVASEINGGLDAYLEWVAGETQPPSTGA